VKKDLCDGIICNTNEYCSEGKCVSWGIKSECTGCK